MEIEKYVVHTKGCMQCVRKYNVVLLFIEFTSCGEVTELKVSAIFYYLIDIVLFLPPNEVSPARKFFVIFISLLWLLCLSAI